MPFTYKHTLMFSGPDHGATESWYFQLDTLDLDAAVLRVKQIPYKRALLLGKEWRIKGERVACVRDAANAPVKRRSVLNRFDFPGYQGQPSEVTGVSLQCIAKNSVKTQTKHIFMCGPWDSLFVGGDGFDFNSAPDGWATNFQAWQSYLCINQFGWLGTVITNPVKYSIIGYSMNVDTGIVTYTTSTPVPWPTMTEPVKVNVAFPSNVTPLDGVQIVNPITATTFKTVKPRPAGGFTNPGLVNLLPTSFVNLGTTNGQGNIGEISPEVPSSRKRGKPLLVSRGRKQNQVKW